MKKKSFTKEEKLRIIKETTEKGIQITLDKDGIYKASYYAWKSKNEKMGEEDFQRGMTPDHLKRIRELEKENMMSKQLRAEK